MSFTTDRTRKWIYRNTNLCLWQKPQRPMITSAVFRLIRASLNFKTVNLDESQLHQYESNRYRRLFSNNRRQVEVPYESEVSFVIQALQNVYTYSWTQRVPKTYIKDNTLQFVDFYVRAHFHVSYFEIFFYRIHTSCKWSLKQICLVQCTENECIQKTMWTKYNTIIIIIFL